MKSGIIHQTLSMTTYKFGDVILVPFPFSDQVGKKKRPAVIVSSNEYNQRRLDIIIMAITSQIKPALSFGEAAVIEWQKAGLLKESILKPTITTIDKNLVINKLGHLSTKDIKSLQETLKIILKP